MKSYLLFLLVIGIILSYIIYKSKNISSTLIQAKYSSWSECDCIKKQKTRKLLQGDPSIFGKPSLLISSCDPDPSLCCQYSDWDKCDCNMKKRRTIVKGESEICKDPLVADCIPDSIDCCKYSNYSICDCQTKKQKREIIEGKSLYCLDPLERDCSYRDYKEDCCNGRGIYSIDSSGNRGCDCTGTGYKGPKCQYSNLTTCNGRGDVSDNGFCNCRSNFKSTNGLMCNECSDGFYGPNCDRTRSNFCYDRGTPTIDGSKCICEADSSGNIYQGLNCQYTVPSAPFDLSGNEENGKVSLSWLAPNNGGTPITSYKVYRNNQFIGYPDPPTSTNYTATGLTNGISYTFKVSAVNIVGEGNSVSIIRTPKNVPGPPIDLSGNATNGQVSFSWKVPLLNGGKPITSYKVYKNNQFIGSPNPPTLTNYTETGLSNGISYTFSISAVNEIGEGSKSEISLKPFTVPGAPALSGKIGGDRKIDLSWTVPNNGGSAIKGYYVYLYPNNGNNKISTIDTKYTVSGLLVSYTYHFFVSAFNDAGDGPSSSLISLVTVGIPPQPTINSYYPNSSGSRSFSWQSNGDGGDPNTTYWMSWNDTSIGWTSPTKVTNNPWYIGPYAQNILGVQLWARNSYGDSTRAYVAS